MLTCAHCPILLGENSYKTAQLWMLQGGYKLPACDDSEECLSLLVSALVVFLKHWLSSPQGTEGIMQSLPSCFCAWFFELFCCIAFIKGLVLSSAAEVQTFISTVEFSRKEYHRSGTLLYSTRTYKTCGVENTCSKVAGNDAFLIRMLTSFFCLPVLSELYLACSGLILLCNFLTISYLSLPHIFIFFW